MVKVSNSDARHRIANRKDFDSHTGAFWGRNVEAGGFYGSMGYLPGEWLSRLHAERPTYVVMSYATAIGWWSEKHGWTVPTVKYSRTTGSRHMPYLRAGVALATA